MELWYVREIHHTIVNKVVVGDEMPLPFTHDAWSHHIQTFIKNNKGKYKMPQGHRLSVTSQHVTTLRRDPCLSHNNDNVCDKRFITTYHIS